MNRKQTENKHKTNIKQTENKHKTNRRQTEDKQKTNRRQTENKQKKMNNLIRRCYTLRLTKETPSSTFIRRSFII
jgi:uncharacterized FlaG/YvyC family protein